ncbi:hypothetical protein TSUD_83460, partial [Trifolium subterraneum]
MQGRKKVVREMIFDPEIEKKAKANRKAVRLAHQATLLTSGTEEILEEEVPSSNTSNDETESMAGVDPSPRRTLGDYGQTTGGHNPNLGFQPVNPVSFDIKNTFLERRNDITNFEQGDSESLYDAWERFKLCLKKCPKHGLDSHAQMQHFTQGLRAQTRMLLDASAGGSLKNKDESEARELVEAMAHNEYRLMNNQMAAMLKHFTTTPAPPMQAKAVQDVKCNFCGQGHANGECFPAGSEEAM